MKTAKHENLWGFEYGQTSAYESFTLFERPHVDYRLALPESDKAHLNMQYGLPGIQENMIFSPDGEKKARQLDEERLEEVREKLRKCLVIEK